ncbi:biotin transport system substrate-specific component [Rhodovulum bhavnagarense]|uniref:Biotin transporter n=1 Tax=Rhodovulum bhavnagarense TaxID=992286 RepID=A0A4R2RHH6_9RHOB|nr:biotin transporter BioY [Rhodovulum bhavnagarense]TCP61899.1 biotin transport system substrate-specific component [Rhodovulum bhavnagarense]
MAQALTDKVLAENLLAGNGAALRVKQVLLVILGIAALAVAAKIRVPMWPSPVPVTMTTFAVLTIGAAYGPRLGLATILGYMTIGALGFDVFASSSAELNGMNYMLGGTGGYLLGYVLAALVLGIAARRGLDRSVLGMGAALLLGNALIYVPGLLWLNQFTAGWTQTLDWGLIPYLVGDLVKLGLAALLIPAAWKLVGRARG